MICRFICKGKRFICKRLDIILNSSSSAITILDKYLNKIYITVLKYMIFSGYLDEEIIEVYNMLKYIFRSIVVLLLPLFASLLSRLLCLLREDINQIFEDLYAILDILKDLIRLLCLYYPLFCDFLLNKD